MCEFCCESGKSSDIENYKGFCIRISGQDTEQPTLAVFYEDEETCGDVCTVIEYCPICGRKLGEQNR